MHYYGTRLSENLSRREPEGYLLCLNVPVARTGTQDYLPEELGLPPAAGMIPVRRPEEEVFSPEALASFEGMPVTNDHPPEGVDISNIRAFQKGHAHNIRRGTGQESDLLLADLIITDERLIRAILEEGKREISCGYTYELCREGGQYIQRKIRGNHVAVVEAGRAGSRVSIKDARKERRTQMKKSLSKALARMAKDGDAETVAEIIEAMIRPEDETPESETVIVTVPEGEAPAAGENPEETAVPAADETTLGDVLVRLDQIIALLSPAAADEEPEDTLAEEVAGAIEEALDPVASVILEPAGDEEETGDPCDPVVTGDALRAAVRAVSPLLARLPEKQRKAVAADIAARLRNGKETVDTGAYAALASARRRLEPASADLGRRIMEKRNSAFRR